MCERADVPYWLYEEARYRIKELEAQVVALNRMIQDKTIPALITSAQALQASQQLMQSLQYQRDIEAQARQRKNKAGCFCKCEECELDNG